MTRYRMFNQSRRKKSPAEEVFAIDDLLTEILQRLPTKVVVQLKLVAKQWQSVISSPHFSLSHTRYQDEEGFLKPSALFQDVVYLQPSTTFMFVPLDRDTTQLPSFDFIDAPYLKIMQSCTDWFFKYRIDLEIEVQTLVYMPNLEDYEVQWFAIHSDEDEGDSMVAIFRNGISVSYNFKEEEIRFARGCPEVENFQYDYDRFRACPYFETLSFV
ncbi:hypothetical protein COLO4_08922 [Corchorus olitorius]|uniref:F-box domain-containing protein n=1 Tax=Corchorus olitorius TaxID=93759 RepID=A0A1R3KE01_9ROSI|nr:hypothetical protein COLO4_08922 [Corchorus olitorius]